MSTNDGAANERRPRAGRRWGRIAIIVGAVVGVLAVAVFALPTFVAGRIASSQLENLGISSKGLESLKIDLWKSKFELGSTEFWSGEAEPGQIGNVSMTYSLANLVKGRAFVDQLVIEGIDVHVKRDEEGAIIVNGIRLDELIASADDAEPAPESEPAEEASWGVGLDGFVLKDSRLILEEATGGTLVVEVDRLIIEDIRSWDPDHAAVIDLAGRFNDIVVDMEAQTHLFTETIMVDSHLRLQSVDMPKITRFTGPLGFERRDGEVSVSLINSAQIRPDGRVLVASRGNIVHTGAELVRPELTFRVAEERIDIDTVVISEPYDTGGDDSLAPAILSLTGSARARGNEVEVSFPGAAELAYAEGTLDLKDIRAVRHPDGRVTLTLIPSWDVVAPRVSEPVEVAADSLKLALSRLGLEMQGGEISLSTDGTVELAAVSVALPDADGASGPEGTVATVRATFDDVSVSAAAGETTVAGALAVALGPLAGKAPLGDAVAMVASEALGVGLNDLEVAIRDGAMTLTGAGSAEIAGLEAAVPILPGQPPVSLEVAGLRTTVDEVAAATGAGAPEWRLGLSLEADALGAGIEGDGAAQIRLGSLTLAAVGADQTLAVSADELALGDLEIELSDRTLAALGGGAAADEADQPEASPPPSDRATEGGAPAAAVRLGRFVINPPAVVRYADTSVDPAVNVEVDLNTVDLANLDMGDPAQRTEVQLAATVNQLAEVTTSGWVAPFQEQPDFDLVASVKNLQLPTYSPYAEGAVGMYLESGALSTDVKAAATGGALDGQIDLEVMDLALTAATAEDEEAASAAFGAPVGMAVGLLEDADGRIALAFPVAGTLAAPQVDFSDAINQAMAGALESLFPPTAIASMLSSDGGGIEFKPITFAPGTAELGPDGQAAADNLATLLEGKPKLSLLVCGRSTAQDGAPAQAGAEAETAAPDAPAPDASAKTAGDGETGTTALAQARTEAVKAYLIETKGLPLERVRECRPKHVPEDTGPPRVDVSF